MVRFREQLKPIFCIVIIVSLLSLALFPLKEWIGYRTVGFILLLLISGLAFFFDLWAVLAASLLSALIWNFFFIPPLFTFHIETNEDFLLFVSYFAVVILDGFFSFYWRKREKIKGEQEERKRSLKLYQNVFSSLSHELRTPLAVVLSSLEAHENTQNPDSKKILLANIKEASERLNQYVENLLSMSRLDSGYFLPVSDWLDIEDVYRDLKNREGYNDEYAVFLNLAPPLPLVKMDRGLFYEILKNVVGNALKHNPDGVIVHVGITYENGHLVVKVSDNGRGILREERERVFEKFYRSSTTKGSGIGLGLSLVKGYVEILQGKIKLETSEEGGLLVLIEIPCEASFINQLSND